MDASHSSLLNLLSSLAGGELESLLLALAGLLAPLLADVLSNGLMVSLRWEAKGSVVSFAGEVVMVGGLAEMPWGCDSVVAIL